MYISPTSCCGHLNLCSEKGFNEIGHYLLTYSESRFTILPSPPSKVVAFSKTAPGWSHFPKHLSNSHFGSTFSVYFKFALCCLR